MSKAGPSYEPRLAVVTEIISPYRVPLFNALAKMMPGRFKVFFMAQHTHARGWRVPEERLRFDYEIFKGIDVKEKLSSDKNSFPCYWNLHVNKALTAFNPDVVVIGGYNHFTSFMVLYYVKKARKVAALWCESTLKDQHSTLPFAQLFKRLFIRSCDAFLVPGTGSERYLNALEARGPIFYAPNSIDADFFPLNTAAGSEVDHEQRRALKKRLGLPEFNMLFVGRLSQEKNVPLALSVTQGLQLLGIDAGLVIAGDGRLKEQCVELSKKLCLKYIYFTGFKSAEELKDYYLASDILILPSTSEPWGLVVNEAMTQGLPVVCSPSVGAAQDLIIEDKTGFVCGHQEEYVQKIKEFYQSSTQQDSMRKECIKHVSNFSPEKCADGFRRLAHSFRACL